MMRLLRATPCRCLSGGGLVDRLIERCAGLDVHKASVVACVRVPGEGGGRRSQTRRFRTTTAGLVLLRDWLASFQVTVVGMPVDRGVLEAGRAPRGSTCPGGGERTLPAACRSRPLKLGAA